MKKSYILVVSMLSIFGFAFALKKQEKQFINYITRLCDNGGSYSCNFLGLRYIHTNHKEKAFYYFKKSCYLGFKTGCYNAGWMLEHGDGIKRDYKDAIFFYRKACYMGSADGCNNLGWMYQFGKGVQKNPAIALEFYQKACKMNPVFDCVNLNHIYKHGFR